jgi:hypothetical protein
MCTLLYDQDKKWLLGWTFENRRKSSQRGPRGRAGSKTMPQISTVSLTISHATHSSQSYHLEKVGEAVNEPVKVNNVCSSTQMASYLWFSVVCQMTDEGNKSCSCSHHCGFRMMRSELLSGTVKAQSISERFYKRRHLHYYVI